MNDYSRDETEFGAFEDPAARGGVRRSVLLGFDGLPETLRTVGQATVLEFRDGVSGETEFGAFEDPAAIGGFFDKLLKPLKKKVDVKVGAQLKAQGATPAQLALVRQAQAKEHVTAKAVAQGAIKSAQIGMAVAAFLVPGGAVAGTAALGGLVAADKLVAAGQRGVAAAKTTIDTTKKLAAAGHIDAQRGLQAIGVASAARAAKGIAAGVEQPLTATGHAALTSFLQQRKPAVVAPVAAAPKRAATTTLPAIKPPAVPARVPIAAAYVPPRPAAVVPRPVAPLPMAAPQSTMTLAALQSTANTFASVIRGGKMSLATARALIARAAASLPVTAANGAGLAAIYHQLDAASAGSTGPGTVVPAPARDWLVTDDGKVQRVVRGNAIQVAGRGWYVGQFGLQRVGA